MNHSLINEANDFSEQSYFPVIYLVGGANICFFSVVFSSADIFRFSQRRAEGRREESMKLTAISGGNGHLSPTFGDDLGDNLKEEGDNGP
ncbi:MULTISPECIES: hypothetical protein [unclassified Serratia (in: enterobacteria)]|uniref:hypothetical protein n=1 Tax=unclassified Serratia (in: enterobacteria) TaxID=2647522 RepID=UPI002ECFFDB8|nr:hypothetical protein [Serratia sp. C2(2)]MEE4446633.1 hypothetical protein [Serratia sp. C2(1)]